LLIVRDKYESMMKQWDLEIKEIYRKELSWS